jgi:lipopolysaccharide/colanic/teichoic acid biosynthesis glycosyltransferase
VPLLIKFTSKGPVLFRQERIGQFEKKFMFLKFRTMHVNNDSSIHQEYVKKLISEQKSCTVKKGNGDKTCIYKMKDDPRITPIGRFLRKMSLDEFPQFFNVLKGEMSLVGPRPPIPYELDNYDIWHKRRVLEIKPGITGLWQVKGRSRTTFDEMVRLDIKYIREWSLWLDTKILFQTPKAVLNGKGAY